jgi:hypothetical protein
LESVVLEVRILKGLTVRIRGGGEAMDFDACQDCGGVEILETCRRVTYQLADVKMCLLNEYSNGRRVLSHCEDEVSDVWRTSVPFNGVWLGGRDGREVRPYT